MNETIRGETEDCYSQHNENHNTYNDCNDDNHNQKYMFIVQTALICNI